MNSNALRKTMLFVIPLDCIYIIMGVASGLHSPVLLRRLPFYMLVVFMLNAFLWRYWASPALKRTPRWRSILRFCVWIVLLVNVPMLALAAAETPTVSLLASLFFATVISGAAFWLSNADLSKQ